MFGVLWISLSQYILPVQLSLPLLTGRFSVCLRDMPPVQESIKTNFERLDEYNCKFTCFDLQVLYDYYIT